MVLNTEVGVFGHTEIEVPDYATRHKYLDSAYKIKGTYAPEKRITANVEVEATELIEALSKKINGVYERTDIPSDGTLPDTVGSEAQDQE